MKIPRATAEALIQGWKDDRLMWHMMLVVSGLNCGEPDIDWDAIMAKTGLPLEKVRYVKMPIRAWVSNNLVNASTELWSNHPNKALRWMISGKDWGTNTRPTRLAVKEFKDAAGYKVIRARAQDKRHDWNTCK